MTTNHHTPITKGAPAEAATINAPLSQLDSAITGLLDGSTPFNQLNLGATTETLTISSGAVTATKAIVILAAETGTADDLVTVNGTSGDLIILQADTGDTITVKHGSGNVYLNGGKDISLSGNKRLMMLRVGTTWSDISYPGNSRSIIVPRTTMASAASVTLFNGTLPAGLSYIEVLIIAKLTGTGTGARPRMIVNNVLGANGEYAFNHTQVRSAFTNTYIDNGLPGVNLPTSTLSGRYGFLKYIIHFPDSGTVRKPVEMSGVCELDVSPFLEYSYGAGNYRDTNDPITRLDLISGGADFDSTSWYEIWGIG